MGDKIPGTGDVDDEGNLIPGTEKTMTTVTVQGTQEQSAGEGELYNAVFYERIPLDYLKQAAAYAYDDMATQSAKNGTDIDVAYLEAVLNDRDENGNLKNIAWMDRFQKNVTAERTRGLKLKVTLEGTTEAPDYGGSMNYKSDALGVCTYVSANQPCLYGGTSVYTSGKTYSDINPRAEGVSNTTTYGLFRIEWVVDESVAGGYITDPGETKVENGTVVTLPQGESRFLPDNELNTGSDLDNINTALRPVDRPDYTSNVVEVGDTVSIAIPVRAATENLPQVYKNLNTSTSTAKNADGTPNTSGLEPAFMPRLGEYYYSGYHLHCGHTGCAAGNFFISPGPGVSDFNLSNNLTGTMRIQNQNVMLDMDSLLREAAVTTDKPKHVDTYEMFNRAYTFIPGTASNARKNGSGAIGESVTNTNGWEQANNYGSSGSDNQLVDADVMTSNNKQKVTYLLTGTPLDGSVLKAKTELPLSYSFVTAGSTAIKGSTDSGYLVRDYFRFVTATRIADALATKADATPGRATKTQDLTVAMSATGTANSTTGAAALSKTPLLWSETRVHMQKAWLATTSEMVTEFDDEYGAGNANDDYQASRIYNHGTSLSNGSLFGVTAFNTEADPNYTDPNKDSYDSGANYLTHWQYVADPTIEFGQYDDALEFGQNYTSQLTAYNYGDRNLDGVSFTYIMPRGVEPQLKVDENGDYVRDADGNYQVEVAAELLKRVNGAYTGRNSDAAHANDAAPYVDETYADIDESLIQVEVLQTPYGTYQGYDAPSAKQDPAVYRTGNRTNLGTDYSTTLEQSTYASVNATTGEASVIGQAAGSDAIDPALMKGKSYTQSSQPWVLRITVKQPLGKWFGRAIDSNPADAADPDPASMADCYVAGGYKLRVNLGSHIFGNNEDEAWYDRLLTAPWDNLEQTEKVSGQWVDGATSGVAGTDAVYEAVAQDAVAGTTDTLYVRDEATGNYAVATAAQLADGAVAKYRRTADAVAAVAATEPFNSSAYYQIYDVDLYEGNAAVPGRRQNVQPYGMDYTWTPMAPGRLGVHAPSYAQFYGSPNFPAINGYTVMNNSVIQDANLADAGSLRASLSNMGLRITDSGSMTYVEGADDARGAMQWTGGQVNQADALKDGVTVYAQTGTHAIMRKPFVRVWNTVSDYNKSEGTVNADGTKTGNTSEAIQVVNEDYFVDTETDFRQLNVHVENRYWLNDQPYYFQRYMNTGHRYGADAGYNTYNSKYHNNYAVDGGQEGTLVLPVITVVLPFGVAPYLKSVSQPALPVDQYEQPSLPEGEKSAILPAQGNIQAKDWDISLVTGADADNYTNLTTAVNEDPSDSASYQTLSSVNDNLSDAWKDANWNVTYAFEPVTTDTGETEYRYVVRFEPKADGYNSDADLVTRIVNDGLATFKLNIMTYGEPKLSVEPSITSRAYDNIRTFVTSKVDGYKYLTDEDITVANGTDGGRTEQPGGNFERESGIQDASMSVVGPLKSNPFTVGSETQLTRQERMTWLAYRASSGAWGNISWTTYNNTLHGLGWHETDKRLDASQSIFYTYINKGDNGATYDTLANVRGVVPTNHINSGNFTTESVPTNYLIGFNGHYTEGNGTDILFGTQRIPNAMGGTGLPARLPLRGSATALEDKNGNLFATPITQGKGLPVGDYSYDGMRYGLSSATTNSMNRGSVRPQAGEDVDADATHLEPFANRYYTDEDARVAAQTHIDGGVYSTVKLRTKVPTLNVDFEVEANPTDRPSDILSKSNANLIDPVTGPPMAGTEATGAGAHEDDIIKTDGSIIHAPETHVVGDIQTTTRVMDDADGNELVKVTEQVNLTTGDTTTVAVERDINGVLKNTAVRTKVGNKITLVLKQYDATGTQVEWSMKKTFTLSQLTGEVDITKADLYMGDLENGGRYVLTENYKRTKRVTTGVLSGVADPVSAVGETFYTRTATYVPLETGYKGTIYVKRTDGDGNDVFLPITSVTDASSTEQQYMDDETEAIYTPLPYTTAAIENAFRNKTDLYVGQGEAYVHVNLEKLPEVEKPYVDPYSYFTYGLPDLGQREATGLTLYQQRTTGATAGQYTPITLATESDYERWASATAPDSYIKLEINGVDTYVLAKLVSKGIDPLSDYVFTVGSLVGEQAITSTALYERTGSSQQQKVDENGDLVFDEDGNPVMETVYTYTPVTLTMDNIATYTESIDGVPPVKLYYASFDDHGRAVYEEATIKKNTVNPATKYGYTIADPGRIVPVSYREPEEGQAPDPFTQFYTYERTETETPVLGDDGKPVYNPDGTIKTETKVTEAYLPVDPAANLDDYLDEYADQLYVKLTLNGADEYVPVDLSRDIEPEPEPDPDPYDRFQYRPDQTIESIRTVITRSVDFAPGILSPDFDDEGNQIILTESYKVPDRTLNWVAANDPYFAINNFKYDPALLDSFGMANDWVQHKTLFLPSSSLGAWQYNETPWFAATALNSADRLDPSEYSDKLEAEGALKHAKLVFAMQLPKQVTFYEDTMLTANKDVAAAYPSLYKYIGDYENDEYAFYVERTYFDRTAERADYEKGEVICDAHGDPLPALLDADVEAGQKVFTAAGLEKPGVTQADLAAGEYVAEADGTRVPSVLPVDLEQEQKVRKFERLTPKQLIAEGWTVNVTYQSDYGDDTFATTGASAVRGGANNANYGKADWDDLTDTVESRGLISDVKSGTQEAHDGRNPDNGAYSTVKPLSHDNDMVVIELATPDDASYDEFQKYPSLLNAYYAGIHADGYLGHGESVTLKLKTRVAPTAPSSRCPMTTTWWSSSWPRPTTPPTTSSRSTRRCSTPTTPASMPTATWATASR